VDINIWAALKICAIAQAICVSAEDAHEAIQTFQGEGKPVY
jgi:hypothetical protein